MGEARVLLVLFMLLNLILCIYVGYELFGVADFLQNALGTDFTELKGWAIWGILSGIAFLALSYWVYKDGINIERLLTEEIPEYPEKEEEIAVLKCPKCDRDLSPDLKLCPFCGYELKTVKCPNCGTEFPKSFNLCPYCGTPKVRKIHKEKEKKE